VIGPSGEFPDVDGRSLMDPLAVPMRLSDTGR